MTQDAREIELQALIDLATDLRTQIEKYQASDDKEEAILKSFALLLDFVEVMRKIDLLFRKAKMESGYQRVTWGEKVIYFNDTLEPARRRYELILAKIFEEAEFEMEFRRNERPQGSPVWNILISGLDFWDNDTTEAYSEHDLKDAEDVMYSSWFRPDAWLIGFDELKPVIGKGMDRRLPGHVRRRLSEVYRSYAFGHYFSSVALCRAVLEYAIKDRAASFNLVLAQPNLKKPGEVQDRRLGTLVGDLGNDVPEIYEQMRTIVDAGNATLHPKVGRSERIPLDEAYLRATAKNAIEAIKVVLERLYR